MDLWSDRWRPSPASLALLGRFSPRYLHVNGFRDLVAFDDAWLLNMDLSKLLTLRLFIADDARGELGVTQAPISCRHRSSSMGYLYVVVV
jgi:hypothetical protein